MGTRRLMAVLAHPDDESLGFGGTLAKYARDGVAVFLLTATRGDSGRFRTQANPHSRRFVKQNCVPQQRFSGSAR